MTMQLGIYRDKLLNAILYFAQNTKYLNTTKLSKLLYFLDFSHFKQTGYPSIGLEYYTFKKGPVPKSFWVEVKDDKVPMDFEGKLAIIPIQDERSHITGYKERLFKALVAPDLSVFSPREVEILKHLSDVWYDSKAKLMTEATHLHNQPWHTTKEQKGLNQQIDYMLCLDDEALVRPKEARESLAEHFEMMENFGIKPSS